MPQSFDINFGVDLRGRLLPVAKQVTDLAK
jgi:hypothetical protein